MNGGIKKAPPKSPLQGALLDPIDIEQALREQPGAVRLHEAIEVAKGRDHQLAAVAVDRDVVGKTISLPSRLVVRQRRYSALPQEMHCGVILVEISEDRGEGQCSSCDGVGFLASM